MPVLERVHARFPHVPACLLTPPARRSVRDANSGSLCLRLCLQPNMLIVFNQQRRCFISMFCAVYSLRDNVVIIKFFPTTKLGDGPSFF